MKKVICLAAALTLCGMLAACSGGDKAKVPVQSVAEICGIGSVGLAERFAGVVSVQDEIKVEKSEDFEIQEFMVEEGDDVEEGDVLFVYDNEQITLDLEKAKLDLEQLENSVKNMQSEKSELEKDKAKAKEDQQLSYALEINSLETDILETNYNIELKKKEIERLEKTLENTEVLSPSYGRIQSINDDGETDIYGSQKPLITIVQSDGFLIKGYVNENNMSQIYEGMNVIVRSRVEDVTWSGSVSKIDFENPAQNQDYYYGGDDGTGTSSKYPFYVTLDESENLMLGQHVYVEPDLGQDSQEDEGSWRLPSWYISDLDTAPFVWAQGSSGKLEKRLVALGSQNEMGEYEITEGLTLEDKIAFPEEGLEEGMICVDYREYTPSEEENYEDYNVEDVPAGYGEEFDLEDGEDYIFDDSDYFEEDWDDDSDDEDYDEDDEDYEDDEDDSDEDDSEDE